MYTINVELDLLFIYVACALINAVYTANYYIINE